MSPDEHDCLDFKEIIAPLTDEYLAMMANAADLRGKDHATVLVGIAEEKDSATGLTSGRDRRAVRGLTPSGRDDRAAVVDD